MKRQHCYVIAQHHVRGWLYYADKTWLHSPALALRFTSYSDAVDFLESIPKGHDISASKIESIFI